MAKLTAKQLFQDTISLAPLAGFSDAALRQIASYQGADICYTEMVSAKGLMYDSKRTATLLITPPSQKIRAVQLFGSEPDVFGKVLEESPLLVPFDIVDINMGCPVHKVTKSSEGSALMKDIPLACRIIKTVKDAARGKIITAKIRAGWDSKTIAAVDMARALEDSGADAITIHPRTREQFYQGDCDYELAGKVVKAVKIPVIISGNIICKDSYQKVRQITGASGVMIGRGALGTNLIGELTAQRDNTECPSFDPIDTYLEHLSLMVQYLGTHYAVTNIRKFTPYYFRHIQGARQLRAQINTCTTIEEITDKVRQLQQIK